jgi:plastocyanin
LSKRSKFAALTAAALVSSLLFPASTATANHAATLEVTVGAFHRGVPAESERFFPEEMTVHRGDTLEFVGEFHTATMLPASVGDTEADLDAWIADNAGEIGDPWHFITNNPDYSPGPFKINGFTANPDCGMPNDRCSYTGGSVLDSGVLFNYSDFSTNPPTINGFNVTVDANPGDSFWVFCRVHGAEMHLKVTVVADNAASTTQQQIDDYKETTLAADRAAAMDLHRDLLTRRESTRRPNGTRVWQAWAGFDTEDFSLFAMYPRQLNVRRGDRVNWNFDQLHHETHTVTQPRQRALRVLNNEPIFCDPNGDDTSGGETPADFSQGFPPSCPQGSELEFIITETFLLPQGDGTVRRHRDFENSGVRGQLGDPPAPGFAPYTLKFAKRSRKAYKYTCLIHPFMRGRVRVSRR